jgi:hypothetical protein
MEQIIIQGGSVSIGGKVISRVQDLPSETSLATNDPEALKTVIAGIDTQIAALQKQRKQAESALKKAETPTDTGGTS